MVINWNSLEVGKTTHCLTHINPDSVSTPPQRWKPRCSSRKGFSLIERVRLGKLPALFQNWDGNKSTKMYVGILIFTHQYIYICVWIRGKCMLMGINQPKWVYRYSHHPIFMFSPSIYQVGWGYQIGNIGYWCILIVTHPSSPAISIEDLLGG